MTHDLRTDGTNVTPHPIAPSNPDAPVRIDVAMPRGLYDRLTDHDEAPRSRYETATGRAETAGEVAFVRADRSRVLPGLDREALDRLLASRTPPEASRRARTLAQQVAHAMPGADHQDPIGER